MTALEEVLSRLDLPEDTQDLLEQTDFDDAKSVAAVMPSTWQNVPAWFKTSCLYSDTVSPAASALAQAMYWCQCCKVSVWCHMSSYSMVITDIPHTTQYVAWPLRLVLCYRPAVLGAEQSHSCAV